MMHRSTQVDDFEGLEQFNILTACSGDLYHMMDDCSDLIFSPHTQVLLSLRLLLMMKPHVLSRVSRQVAYGLHELLKTNAANIHCTDDWYTLFSLLECIGAGVKPPASFQLATTSTENDTGSVFLFFICLIC